MSLRPAWINSKAVFQKTPKGHSFECINTYPAAPVVQGDPALVLSDFQQVEELKGG